MKNANSTKGSVLKNLFDRMSYNMAEPKDTNQSILKWVKDQRKGTLTSVMFGEPITNESDSVLPLSLFGESITVRLINQMDSIHGKKDTRDMPEYVPYFDASERVANFQELIKNNRSELIKLESYAGGVSACSVENADFLSWVSCTTSPAVTQISKTIKGCFGIFFIELDRKLYCLEDLIVALTAAMETDKKFTVALALKNPSNVPLLLPALYLIDAVNNASLCTESINTILLNSEIIMSKTDPFCKGLISPKEQVVVVGNTQLPGSYFVQAALVLTQKNDRSYHFVVTDSADVTSAASSISRIVQNSGIRINHRPRSLAFVHQSMYNQLIAELQACAENKIVQESNDTEMSTKCDYVFKKMEADEESILQSIQNLGAKTIAPTNDLSGPTIVHDIGTSSDLVALRTPGLGHLLVVIPYRSEAELLLLCNNHGHPENLFLYSADCTPTIKLMRKLKGEQIIVNDVTEPTSRGLIRTSWTTLGHSDGNSLKEKPCTEDSKRVLKISPNKPWNYLSTRDKVDQLQKILNAGRRKTDFLMPFLYTFFIHRDFTITRMRLEIDGEINGLILLDPATKISFDSILGAISACCLRGGSTVVGSLISDVPAEIKDVVKANLPDGLVTFFTMESISELGNLAQNWETLWIIKDEDSQIPSSAIPVKSLKKLLLVNNDAEYHSIQSAGITLIKAGYDQMFI